MKLLWLKKGQMDAIYLAVRHELDNNNDKQGMKGYVRLLHEVKQKLERKV